MKLSYELDIENHTGEDFTFPMGKIQNERLHLGSLVTSTTIQLRESQVLAILGEVVQLTNAKIIIKFEEGITLEFE